MSLTLFTKTKSKLMLLLTIVMVPGFMAVTSLEDHKFYVSLTQVEYVKEKQSLQIISRVFLDDIEDALKAFSGESLRISSDSNDTTYDALIENYFRSKLKFEIDSKKVSWKFVGKAIDNDMLVVYMEVSQLKKIKSIVITNEVLFEIFEEQQNIVRTQINNKNKSFILISQDRSKVLNF